jgi:hypothetical protein
LRATLTALRNASGKSTAEPKFRVHAAVEQVGDDRTEHAEVDERASPSAAPSACGCACTMSVPIATLTHSGTSARAHVARTDDAACGAAASSSASPSDRPMPRSRCAAIAPRMKSAVAPDMPNVPSCNAVSTSSDVLPTSASSVSWIVTDPLAATALTKPVADRSQSIRRARP